MSQTSFPSSPEVVVVFAHPDDEFLFFFHTLRRLRPRRLRLVCATGKFAPGSAVRRSELEKSAEVLGGDLTCLELWDRLGGPLDAAALETALVSLEKAPGVPVLTHGPLGEYGHRHHVDLFHAVQRRFPDDAWCLSGPLEADFVERPGDTERREQRALLEDVYADQGNIWDWCGADEELTHVASCPWADVLAAARQRGSAAPQRRRDFLALIERRYLSSREALPGVARVILEAWEAGPLSGDMYPQLRARFQEWRAALAPMPAAVAGI